MHLSPVSSFVPCACLDCYGHLIEAETHGAKGLLILENAVVRVFDEDRENSKLQICRGYGEGMACITLDS
jgi:hypothetical protein